MQGRETSCRFTAIGFSVSVFLLTFCATVSAQTPLIDAVRKKYTAKNSISTNFSLAIFWKAREKTENKNGTMLFSPGDKFRVDLDNATWVCNGQTFWQYSSGSNQVIIKRLLDVDLSSHPSQMLTNYLVKYQYTITEESDQQIILAWHADSAAPKAVYKAITLWVDKSDTVVSKLVVVDRSGNESTYGFKKTKFGVTPPAGSFEFEPPKGARILDTRD